MKETANSYYFNTQQEQDSLAISKSPELLAQRIHSLNRNAEQKLASKDYASALSSLKVCEHMLQYVAESCRDVKKELIIVVLHNIVCLSQALWDLQSASDYLEGIIYNLEMAGSHLSLSRSVSKLSFLISEVSQNVDQKEDLAKLRYYLQYCAISSSLERHRNAEVAARKSLKLTLTQLRTLEIDKKKYIVKSSTLKQTSSKLSIILAMIDLKICIDSDSRKDELFALVWSIYQTECQAAKTNQERVLFKGTSIGNVMTLNFKSFREESSDRKQIEDSEYYVFLLASMSLFSLSTELNFTHNGQPNEAKNHHFLSLLLYLLFVPYQSPYIYYLLETYNSNYTQMTLKSHKKKHLRDLTDLLKTYEQTQELPQQSVATPVMNRRIHQRNLERVKVQSKRLQEIVQFDPKNQKPYSKSQSMKAHSLSLSKNQLHKLSCDEMTRKKRLNRTDLSLGKNIKKGQEMGLKSVKQKGSKKQGMVDEVGEKYFALAFEGAKKQETKGMNGSSSSETNDRSRSGLTKRVSTPRGKRSPFKTIHSKRKLKP